MHEAYEKKEKKKNEKNHSRKEHHNHEEHIEHFSKKRIHDSFAPFCKWIKTTERKLNELNERMNEKKWSSLSLSAATYCLHLYV